MIQNIYQQNKYQKRNKTKISKPLQISTHHYANVEAKHKILNTKASHHFDAVSHIYTYKLRIPY